MNNTVNIRLADGRTVQMKSDSSISLFSSDSVKRIFAAVSICATFMVCAGLMIMAK